MPPPIAIPGAASLLLPQAAPPVVQPVTTIAVDTPLTLRRAQISGLAWYGDTLILLPQFPAEFGDHLFGIPKAALVAQLTGQDPSPLVPEWIAFDDGTLPAQLVGFEGFEAIAFADNNVYLTIETSGWSGMLGYVVAGTMLPEQNQLRLDPTRLAPIEPQTELNNLTDEALVLIGSQIATIYEANGLFLNPSPVAHLFDRTTLAPIGTTPFPTIEYRITDATALDENGRFWATNYFSPETPALRPILQSRGADGPINTQAQPVERLLEFAVTPQGIVRTEHPPIALELLPNQGDLSGASGWRGRNWEGIARLETPEFNGFLIATDMAPQTILAFVPLP